MSTVYAPRRRAEAFAAAVDGIGPPTAGESPLLALVDALRRESATDPLAVPRTAFVASLRDLLVAEATSLAAAQPPARAQQSPDGGPGAPAPRRSARRRSVATAAVAAVMVGSGGVGVANAAQTALPGDALYPVKRAIEHVQTGLAPTSRARGHHLLDMSGTRLAEADTLLRAGDERPATAEVEASLADFVAQAKDGTDLMLEEYRTSGNPDTIDDVRTFVAEQVAALTALSGTLPSEVAPELAQALALLSDIDDQARDLCGSCSDQPPVQVPGVLLGAGSSAAPDPSVPPAAPSAPGGTEAPAPAGPSVQPPSVRPPSVQPPSGSVTAPTPGGLPGAAVPGTGAPTTGGQGGGDQGQPGTLPDSRPPAPASPPASPSPSSPASPEPSDPDPSPATPASPGGVVVPSSPDSTVPSAGPRADAAISDPPTNDPLTSDPVTGDPVTSGGGTSVSDGASVGETPTDRSSAGGGATGAPSDGAGVADPLT